MNTRETRSFRPKACLRCGGDGYFNRDDQDWICLQCGRVVAGPNGIVRFELKSEDAGSKVLEVAGGREAA
jgi:hypothetical protein